MDYTNQKKYRDKLKKDILDHYGRKCVICGFDSDDRFLSIDHINGLSENEPKNQRAGYGLYLRLRRDKFPKGFQTLCISCNRNKQ